MVAARHVLFLVLIFSLGLLANAPAQSAEVGFPPVNEGNCQASGAAFLGWVGGTGTYCATGAEIVANAMPSCANGQYVVFQSGHYVCASFTGFGAPVPCGNAAGSGATCWPLTFQ